MTLLGSGGVAVALVNVLKAFFERNSSIQMEFRRDDGKEMRISVHNMKADEIERTRALAREFFGGSH